MKPNQSKTKTRTKAGRTASLRCDALVRLSDLEVLRIVGKEKPGFVDIIAGEIDNGRTDEEIIRLVCDSGGSPQVMRYTQKCLRALRRLAALDALTAESQHLGLYEPNTSFAVPVDENKI